MAGGAWLLLTGHSPYRQWEVYRKVRLVLLVDAEDAASVRLGQAITGVLSKHLPESRAMTARARDINDLVRLIATRQLDTALMREDDAWTALSGTGRFADNGNVPLRTLAQLDKYVFVCRDDLPRPSAYRLAETLAEQWPQIGAALPNGARGPRPASSARIPVHPGANEYYEDHPQQHDGSAGSAASVDRSPN
jgi:TRAP-type uncharacterized transport system substrate-binding protein